MSFSRLKPLPKAIIIGSIVALIVAGANYGLGMLPKKQPAVHTPPVEITQVPAEQIDPAVTPKQEAEAAVQAAQQAAQSAPTPIVTDAGLDAVLGAGRK